MVCCGGEVRLIVPGLGWAGWLAGWVVGWVCGVLTCGSCLCRRGPWLETWGGQEPAVGEAVGTGAGQAAAQRP